MKDEEIANCGLRIADWKIRIWRSKSAIRNLQFAMFLQRAPAIIDALIPRNR